MVSKLIEEMNTIMIELNLSVKEIKADYYKAGSSRSIGANVNLFHYRVSKVSAVYNAPIQADVLDMDTNVISRRIQRGASIQLNRSA